MITHVSSCIHLCVHVSIVRVFFDCCFFHSGETSKSQVVPGKYLSSSCFVAACRCRTRQAKAGKSWENHGEYWVNHGLTHRF